MTNFFTVEYLRYAHGITSEYLEPDLAEKLREHLKIPAEDLKKEKKRTQASKGDEKEEPSCKRVRRKSGEGPTEDYSKGSGGAAKRESPALNHKQKALAKSAGGTKNIMSFFKKK